MARAPLPNRHQLYELCVQDAPAVAHWLSRLLGARAATATLGEDFCGTAAVSRAFLRRHPEARAIGVDHDAEALQQGPGLEGLSLIEAALGQGADLPAVDLIHVGNFSLGCFRERAALVAYLRESHGRLRPGGGFVAEIYGGSSAFELGEAVRVHRHPLGHRVEYTWQQRCLDPLTGHMEVVLHFEVDARDGRRVRYPDAFVYPWRLWSLSEVRDALLEAGFARVIAVDRTEGLGTEEAALREGTAEWPASFVAMMVAWR